MNPTHPRRPPLGRSSPHWLLGAVALVSVAVGSVGRAPGAGWSGAAPLAETVSITVSDRLTLEATAWLGLKPPKQSSGMVPIDVRLTNGTERPAAVSVTGDFRDGFSGPWGGLVPNAAIRVPAGATVATRLLVDPWPNAMGRSHVSIQPGSGGSIGVTLEPNFTGGDLDATVLAITRGVDALPGAAQANLGAPWGLVTAGDCPPDWRGWTILTRLAITADEWGALPGDAKDAARHWVALGGRLTVFGTNAVEGLPAAGALGSGRIDYLSSADGSLVGGIPVSASTNVTQPDGVAPAGQVGYPVGQGGGTGFRGPIGDALMRLVGFRGLPVIPLMAILILLAVIAGPVNLLVFAGKGRRARLFWTTPLITIGATALLLSFMMLRDGIGAVGVRRVLCVLVPEHTTMAVIQEQATRTAILLRNDFPITEPAWMLPVGDYQGGSLATESGSGRRSGDWFNGRADQAYALFAIRPSRSRITVVETAADGTPTIVSSIDQTLGSLFYRDATGAVWTTTGLPAGVRRACTPSTEDDLRQFTNDIRGDAGLFPSRALDRVVTLRGHVFATGDDVAAAAIGTLESIRWKDERVFFAGPVVDEAPR